MVSGEREVFPENDSCHPKTHMKNRWSEQLSSATLLPVD